MNKLSVGENVLSKEQFAARRTRSREHSIPELLDLLASGDLATRFFAEMALRDKTSV